MQGSHRDEIQDSSLLGYDAVHFGIYNQVL